MSEWISIKDKWPNEGERVLFYCDEREQFAGRFHVGKFTPFVYKDGESPFPEFSMPGFGGILPTHWMPLPEPPK